jgi:hypothetical protein
MTANFVSILATSVQFRSSSPSLFLTTFTGLTHIVYGAIIGATGATARRRPGVAAVVAAGTAGTAMAAGLHLAHDYLPWALATKATSAAGGLSFLAALPDLVGVFGLAAIVAWAWASEAAIVAGRLGEEVSAGVILPAEYSAISNPGLRLAALTSTLIKEGEREWRLRRRLYATEIELAFAKQARDRAGLKADRLSKVDECRARIEAIRLEMARPGRTP